MRKSRNRRRRLQHVPPGGMPPFRFESVAGRSPSAIESAAQPLVGGGVPTMAKMAACTASRMIHPITQTPTARQVLV